MIVTILSRSEIALEAADYWDFVKVAIDGELVFSVRDDEPEDSNLRRSFNSCYSIDSLMKQMYEAGKRGETVEFLREVIDDRND